MGIHILNIRFHVTIYKRFCFLKHFPTNALFSSQPWTYCSLGTGAGILEHCHQQGAPDRWVGAQLGDSQPAVLAPFPPFGRAKVTCPSKTPEEGVEESHIPLAGTGERAF